MYKLIPPHEITYRNSLKNVMMRRTSKKTICSVKYEQQYY